MTSTASSGSATLSADLIVATARAIAEAGGLDALWTRSTRLAESHPSLAQLLANGDAHGSSLVKINEIIVSCLEEAGLSDDDIGLFHQFILAIMMGESALKASWVPDPDKERAQARRFYGALDLAEAPASSGHALQLFPDFAVVDRFLRALMIDSIDRRSSQQVEMVVEVE